MNIVPKNVYLRLLHMLQLYQHNPLLLIENQEMFYGTFVVILFFPRVGRLCHEVVPVSISER